MIYAANIYYFKVIAKIGGIETFLWELVKKYQDQDILILYDNGDTKQLERLSYLCRIHKRQDNEIYECERAFFNFNLDAINQIKAKEKILVIHGNYIYNPNTDINSVPYHKDIDRVIAVSKDSADAYKQLKGIECEVSYNPLTIELEQKPIVLVSATRLTQEKGPKYMKALATKLMEIGKPYIWLIFSSNTSIKLPGNVCVMPGTLDVRKYMQLADWVVQLSVPYSEGYCYTINEALSYGIPCILTNQGVYKEIGIYETPSLFINDDMSNIDQIAKKIFEPVKTFSYKPPKDSWGNLLVKSKRKELKPMELVKVKATDLCEKRATRPIELDHIPVKDEIFKVSPDRAIILKEKGLIEILKETVKQEPIKEEPKETPKEEIKKLEEESEIKIVKKKTTKKK